ARVGQRVGARITAVEGEQPADVLAGALAPGGVGFLGSIRLQRQARDVGGGVPLRRVGCFAPGHGVVAGQAGRVGADRRTGLEGGGTVLGRGRGGNHGKAGGEAGGCRFHQSDSPSKGGRAHGHSQASAKMPIIANTAISFSPTASTTPIHVPSPTRAAWPSPPRRRWCRSSPATAPMNGPAN